MGLEINSLQFREIMKNILSLNMDAIGIFIFFERKNVDTENIDNTKQFPGREVQDIGWATLIGLTHRIKHI